MKQIFEASGLIQASWLPPICTSGWASTPCLDTSPCTERKLSSAVGGLRGWDAHNILSFMRAKSALGQAKPQGLRANFLLLTPYTVLCTALGPKPLQYTYRAHTYWGKLETSHFWMQNRSLHTIPPFVQAYLALVPAYTYFQVQPTSLSCENSDASCLPPENLRFVFSI